MATSAGDSSILEEELTCPVCLELYRDPHLLPCGHNFCLPCLRRLKSRSDHGRLRCPECRQSHRSSANWQKNFKLANIADGFRRRGQSERSAQSRSNPSHRPAEVRCDYCPGDGSEDGKGPMAVKTCLKCEVSMCPKHVQPHLELPAFREHPLVEPLNDMRKRKCLEHDEMFRYYCMDERLFLCNACTIEGTHNGHCIKTLKNTMKDFKVYLDIQMHKTNRKILKAEKNRLEQKEIERHNKAYRDDTDQHLDAFRETSIVHLDAFLSSLRECVSTYDSEQCSGIQQNLSRIAQDQTRLQEVHSGFERLLHESDAFQFIKDYNSSMKRYQKQLRKPLFFPDEPTVDTEPLYETMEGKMGEFIAELRQHTSTLISTLCEFEGGDGEEEVVDDDDDDEESFDDDDDDDENESDAEGEEEMRSEEEEEQHLTESGDEEYTPEEEEDDEED
ncbi:E3 ubiquitin/ISG15 ligase TRIM25 isoform X1 [Megalobrama amblycephala]|uniref:E3 ubiquitin/ISG15 ligase TRIM25 isoform X1 n=1 Tax=Megalobrama amblycephala TaxID=75352 RepID=UPI0020142592|nr:E3 ubiquitin/ISG15 ligase TRIM25 isoform X1 [Megalobrama amblycephala]XP_048041306.1 E3 ubiquitin/ISG15 ligase TRIM25 isoform X1 [Megalobrama amblycephala]XP_048041308.1 E3 ubiquitin/ISG15 ligase TRIM25 isoform X1 [Megalobrama amblycephala]